MKHISGIHHITAIVGDAQENVNFYEGVLGLRLVKKTVNFDDPGTYHLYFGDEDGSPGTIMTFFPWPADYKGKIGTGQVGITSFDVPKGALSFWEKRLTQFKIPLTKQERFHEQTLQFSDPHGLKLELVEREQGNKRKWEISDIPIDYAIKGFAGAVLFSAVPNRTDIPVFIGAGKNDPLCPPQESVDLEKLLGDAGAKVHVHWESFGHQLTKSEVEAAKEWYQLHF